MISSFVTSRRRWTREAIQSALRQAFEDTGRVWTVQAWRAQKRHPAVPTILRVFGHWYDAWQSVSVPVDGLYVPWSSERVLGVLIRYYCRTGHRPTAAEWDAAHRHPTVATIRQYWQSWNHAWEVACRTSDQPGTADDRLPGDP